jgi:hypothetical protein
VNTDATAENGTMRITIVDKRRKALPLSVMAEPVPAMHHPCVDGRDTPGHDGR